MIIAITYDKDTNTVFQHFGRTEYFYFYNTDTKVTKIIDNNGYSHHELITLLKDLNVDTLICGGIGTHAVEAFNKLNINLIVGVQGDVEEVIKDYLEDKLVNNLDTIHACSHRH